MEEAPQGIPAVMSKMPLVDLTALAPEKQQAISQVTEGWKEGTTNREESMAPASIRDITQKIHGIGVLLLLTYLMHNTPALYRVENGST